MFSAFRKKLLVAALSCACLLVLAPGASAQSSSKSGGATFVPPPPPPAKGALVNGRLVAPASAPRRVKQVITAANRIVEKPYRYGGGHTTYSSRRLDSGCGWLGRRPTPSTGAASCAPHSRAGCSCAGASAVPATGSRSTHTADTPTSWWRAIADTSMRDRDAPGPSTGPRWSRTLRTSSAFVARHPSGY